FVEGNAAQFSWFVPHDLSSLVDLMGGQKFFNEALQSSFLKAARHDFVAKKGETDEETKQNRRVYINYGNQPSMQTAFIFNYSGNPYLTQYWSREVVEKVYSGISPEAGYSGDEDQGLMGSLAVLMKMGIFSMKGGASQEPYYDIGSPIFEEIRIKLDPAYFEGGEFVIEANNTSSQNRYIQSANLNGEPLNQAWFYHKDLVKGGSLKLEMGAEPNTQWGAGLEALPPKIEE
ncbi:MAG: glycoside hydrolase domain-containing protein, partial [Bacteroidota bacterium]